jgi:hypothetical protein
MLETKIVKNDLRKCCGRFSKENEEPPGDGGRDGEASQATQRRQGNLDCAGQPAGRGLRQPDAGCVLNLKEKQKFFFKEIFPPTTH